MIDSCVETTDVEEIIGLGEDDLSFFVTFAPKIVLCGSSLSTA